MDNQDKNRELRTCLHKILSNWINKSANYSIEFNMCTTDYADFIDDLILAISKAESNYYDSKQLLERIFETLRRL